MEYIQPPCLIKEPCPHCKGFNYFLEPGDKTGTLVKHCLNCGHEEDIEGKFHVRLERIGNKERV